MSIELIAMACPDVKLACCRLCHKPIASDLGACIHCGVCNPVEQETCNWWHRTLFIILIIGTVLATLHFDGRDRTESDCRFEEIGRARGC